MHNEYEIREVAAQLVMSERASVPPAEIGSIMGELIPRVFGYVMQSGGQPMGPPYSRYFSMGEEQIDLECGVAVAAPLPASGGILPGELPGGSVAVGTHIGPYDRIGESYGALSAWIASEGYQPAGAPWEVYMTDPVAEPDPEKWRTDIYFPVGKLG